MKITLYILLSLLLYSIIGKAQQNICKPIYFNLSSVEYKKNELKDRIVQIKTKRIVNEYMFSIPCNHCQPIRDVLSFYSHNNPETGDIFDPIKIIDNKTFKRLKFMSFNNLVSFLRDHNNEIIQKIYFIETINGIHYQYNVAMLGNFGTE
ncbi:MAG: hypothetical protein V4520_09995 [Bacteroidota bacterium]